MAASTVVSEGLFDMQAALKRLGGSQQLLREMFQFFVEDSPALVDGLEQSLAKGQRDEALRAAHSLKGLASNFDALAVTRLAKQIEEHLRKGEMAQAQELAVGIRPNVAASIAAGRRLLGLPQEVP